VAIDDGQSKSPIIAALESIRQADVFQAIAPPTLVPDPAIGEHPRTPPILPVIVVTDINGIFALRLPSSRKPSAFLIDDKDRDHASMRRDASP
jgi:hypothetical protein